MAFKIIRLEDRIVLDGAGAAVISVTSDSADHVSDHIDSNETHSDDGSDHDTTDITDTVHDVVSSANVMHDSDGSRSAVLIVSESAPNAEELISETDDQTLVIRYSAEDTTSQRLLDNIKDILGDTKVDSIAFVGDSHGDDSMDLASDSVLSVTNLAVSDAQQEFWHDVGKLINDDGYIDLFCDSIVDDNISSFLSDQIGALSGHSVSIFYSVDDASALTSDTPHVTEAAYDSSDSDTSFHISHDTIEQSAFVESIASIVTEGAHDGLDIVLLDTSLDDYMDIAKAVDSDSVVIFYDSATESADDVIQKAVDYASLTDTSIDSLSIMSHGTTGTFKLGNEWISSDNLSSYAATWNALDSVMNDGANLYLYGCNVAENSDVGQVLLDGIASATHTDVFASDDITGYGGDWDLEASSWGSYDELTAGLNIPLDLSMLSDYSGTLAPPTIVSAITVDNDGDGQIDYIQIVTDQNLDDDFSGLTATVAGYTVAGYTTEIGAGGANDNTFYIQINESGSPDTNATPEVSITTNTTLSNLGGENISTSVSTDTGANPPSGYGGGSGDDPVAVYADGGNDCYIAYTQYQIWDSFSLADSIPDGATIEGIEVVVDATSVGASQVSLSWNGGGSFTATQSYSTVGATTLGGPADTWGHTWTKDQLSDANFNLRIAVGGINFSGTWVDFLTVKVYYTATTSITADDVNDAPVANNATVALSEGAGNGTTVHTVVATDADVGDTLTYAITAGNADGVFAINATTGEITVTDNTNLDRETTSSYSLTVQASDGSITDNATITVNVSDVNEFTPAATDASVSLTENSANGTIVHTVLASDNDATASLTYAITGGNGAGVFTINAGTGEITVADNTNLDRESYSSFALDVTVSDGTNSDTATITVDVTDVNEFTPVVSNATVSLAETTSNGNSVYSVVATDADTQAILTYSITAGNGDGVFTIDANTGEISVLDNSSIDAGLTPSYTLTVEVSDGTNTGTADITVNINDLQIIQAIAVDYDGDGQIDHIQMIVNDSLNDDFSGFSVTVDGYTLDATTPYLTTLDAGGAGDNTFYIKINESGSGDTNATPLITITGNTTLGNLSGDILPASTSGNTGIANPTATGDDYNQWNTPSNAYADDGSFTYLYDDNRIGDMQDWYNFNLSIPANATITGIQVITEGYTDDANDTCEMAVSLSWDGGTSYTTAYTHTYQDRDTWQTTGDSAFTWGRTWTVDELNNTNFRVRGEATLIDASNYIFVDVVEIKVYYTTSISIIADDVNDAPTAGDGTVSLAEDASNGTNVHTVAATDIDVDASLTYAITGGNADGIFTIDANTGEITVTDNTNLDRETTSAYALEVTVSDGTNTDTATINVNVTDVNEYAPVATDATVSLAENTANSTPVHTVVATDTDADAVLTYAITGGNASGVFTIDAATGEITVADNTNLDRENYASFALTVTVSDGANSDTASITVNVTDVNEYTPVANDATVSLPENSPNTTGVHTVVATDTDATATLTYSITGGNAAGVFTIDAATGEITVADNSNLDRESYASFALNVTVSDGTLSDTATITINVTDVNEYAPVAVTDTVALTENSANGTSVHTVTAADADPDAVLTYAITGGNAVGVFTINATTGEITVADNTNLDRESYASFVLAVNVSDGTFSDTASITVNVTDVSEFAPIANNATISLAENSANATSVHTVTATDADPDAVLAYAITGGNAAGVFTINAATGEITVADNTNLDRESVASFALTVQVNDGTFSDTATITINVTDVNDNVPVANDATVSLAENSANTTSVHTVVATDADPTAVLTYAITGGNGAGVFTIDANTGEITVTDNTNLDRETYASFALTVTVSDGTNSDTANITVNVNDVNEFTPVAADNTVSLTENSANGTSVHTVAATDADATAVLTYSITGGNAAGVFTIDANTGEITVADNTNLDRESVASFALTVTVSDGTNSDTATINVDVTDVSEFAPAATDATVALTENSANGTSVHTVAATDADADAVLTYAITGGNGAGVFTIDANTGEITVTDNTNLDRENYASFSLTVQVNDGTFSDSATITINVTDVNDNAPVANDATVSLAENSANTTSVHTVVATDADPTAVLTYAITGGNGAGVFTIDTNTGEITVTDNTNLDRESFASFALTVTVSDGTNSNAANITVNVTDVNEYVPSATDATVSLAENSANATSVHTVVATDADPDAVLTYAITGGNAAGVFTINAVTGEITVADNTNLDREAVASFALTVTVSDGTNTDTANITVNVNDVNEFAPVGTDATVALVENSANGTSVHTVAATDADPTASLTYAITGGNGAGVFTIDGATGEITVADNTNLDRETAASFALTVTVSDGTNTDTANITVNVNDVNEFVPVGTDATVALAENSANGTSVHTVVATDADATASLTYSITNGNASGVFAINTTTGEITVADNTNLDRETTASFALTVQVSDGTNTDTANITVNVTDVNEFAPQAQDASVILAENSANGTGVHTVIATDTDPDAVLAYSITGGNAAGVFAIDGATGQITVADNTNLDREATASFVLTVQVSDGTNSDVATITVNLTDINEFAPVANDATVSLLEDAANSTSVHTVAATDTDSSAVLAYALVGGNSGGVFTIDAATGEITVADNTLLDRETTASYALTVQVSDGTYTDTATITVNISDVNDSTPVVSPATLSLMENAPNGTVVHAVAATDADSGATLTYAIVGGNNDGVFTIDTATGIITVADNTLLDRETVASFDLAVNVSDGTFASTGAITIHVADVNEFAPVTDPNPEAVDIPENAADGSHVYTMPATDADPDAVLTYAITGGNDDGIFTIDPNTGEVTILDNSIIDSDTTPNFTLTLEVSDGTHTSSSDITVNISDVIVNTTNTEELETSPETLPDSGQPYFDSEETLTVDPEEDGVNGLSDLDQLGETLESITKTEQDQIDGLGQQIFTAAYAAQSNRPNYYGNNTLTIDGPGIDLSHYIDDYDYSDALDFYHNNFLSENITPQDESGVDQYMQDRNGLWNDIDAMKRDIQDDVSQFSESDPDALVVSAVTGFVTLVAGYVAWINKVFSIFLSLFTSSPLWQSFDPIPIFDAQRNEASGSKGWEDNETAIHEKHDDTSLDSFFDEDTKPK